MNIFEKMLHEIKKVIVPSKGIMPDQLWRARRNNKKRRK